MGTDVDVGVSILGFSPRAETPQAHGRVPSCCLGLPLINHALPPFGGRAELIVLKPIALSVSLRGVSADAGAANKHKSRKL